MSQQQKFYEGTIIPDLETLTGDFGGTVQGDVNHNIFIRGGDGITTVGNPVLNDITLNLNDIITVTTCNATTFHVDNANRAVNMTGTSLEAVGTDPNIDISITPQGSGVVIMENIGNAISTTAIHIEPTGEVTKPLQPSFSAFLPATANNVTGNGATYWFGTDLTTVIYNQGGHYSIVTGLFTAPVDGIYLITASFMANNLNTARNFEAIIQTTARRYMDLTGRGASNVGSGGSITRLCDMSAGDTARFGMVVTGEAGDTAGIVGDAADFFTGFSGILIS